MTASSESTDSVRSTIVLQSSAKPDGTTRYVVQLAVGRAADIEFRYFSWRAAMLDRWDVFHVHWPEFLLRAGSRRAAAAKRVLFLAFLCRIVLTRRAVVRTLHNVTPHESGSKVENALLAMLDRRVTTYIRLNRHTLPPRSGVRVVDIPHGHYKDWFQLPSGSPRIAGRVLNFGLIRPYKGIEDLVSEFTEHAGRDETLRIVGKPIDDDWRRRIENAVADDDRISARLAFVPDEELIAEIAQAELVVLPYREMHNSGVVLVALSLGRPVVIPANAVTDDLRQEVGAEWVTTFSDTFTWAVVERALALARSGDQCAPPELEGRDWVTVGQLHAEVYRQACGR